MILPITYEKEPSLHRPSQPVTAITNEILDLIDDMFETMNQSNGIGLALKLKICLLSFCSTKSTTLTGFYLSIA